jgi:hypothetical protein
MTMFDLKPAVDSASKAKNARQLRDSLKQHGLEHAVRLMTVPERGEARKLMRDALKLYADTLDPTNDG